MTNDELIDRIIKKMVFRQYYSKEELWLMANDGVLNLDADKKESIISLLKHHKLIEWEDFGVLDFKYCLSELGNFVKESGGWIEYNKKPLPIEPPKEPMTFKIIAAIESLVIIIFVPAGLYIQSTSQTLDQENKSLNTELRMVRHQRDSLQHFSETQATQIKVCDSLLQVRQKSIESLSKRIGNRRSR